MVQHFKCVIFDVDGTILDTSEGIFESVEYTIKHFGFHDLTDKQLKEFIGPPIQNSFSSKYDLHGDILQEIATVFRDRYKSEGIYNKEQRAAVHNLNNGTTIIESGKIVSDGEVGSIYNQAGNQEHT